MDGAMIAWVADYGAPFVFLGTLLSCLGAPIPAAIIMLAAGAAVAIESEPILPFLLAAYLGAVLAGTSLFALARAYGGTIVARLERLPLWGGLIQKAHRRVESWGGFAVLIGASFVAQLGPAVNVISGAAGLGWTSFNLSHLTGRAVWVSAYLGLGYAFSDEIKSVALLLTQLSWFAVGAIGLVAAAWLIRQAMKKENGK